MLTLRPLGSPDIRARTEGTDREQGVGLTAQKAEHPDAPGLDTASLWLTLGLEMLTRYRFFTLGPVLAAPSRSFPPPHPGRCQRYIS